MWWKSKFQSQLLTKQRCWPLAFTFYKAFLKRIWSNFTVWLPLLLEILGNVYIVIIYCPVCDVINFEINYSFLIKPFFYVTKNSGQKFNYVREDLLTWNKNHFSSFLKGFRLSEIPQARDWTLKVCYKQFVLFKSSWKYWLKTFRALCVELSTLEAKAKASESKIIVIIEIKRTEIALEIARI